MKKILLASMLLASSALMSTSAFAGVTEEDLLNDAKTTGDVVTVICSATARSTRSIVIL
jgi:hypothetical protein